MLSNTQPRTKSPSPSFNSAPNMTLLDHEPFHNNIAVAIGDGNARKLKCLTVYAIVVSIVGAAAVALVIWLWLIPPTDQLANGEAIDVNCPTVITMPAANGADKFYSPSPACILRSSDGVYGLYFDGRLKLYQHNAVSQTVGPPVWQDASLLASDKLKLQGDLNICLDPGPWCTYTHYANCPARKGSATIQVTSSGQLQVLNIDGAIIWSTPPPIPDITQNHQFTACCTDSSLNRNKGCTVNGKV